MTSRDLSEAHEAAKAESELGTRLRVAWKTAGDFDRSLRASRELLDMASRQMRAYRDVILADRRTFPGVDGIEFDFPFRRELRDRWPFMDLRCEVASTRRALT